MSDDELSMEGRMNYAGYRGTNTDNPEIRSILIQSLGYPYPIVRHAEAVDYILDTLSDAGLMAVPRDLRVWRAGDPQPEGVRAVMTYTGDVLMRKGYGWLAPGDEDCYRWDTILNFHGPLVEVALPTPVTE